MVKRPYLLTVRGRRHGWCFDVRVDPKYVPEYEADGLEVDEVANTVPQWVAQLGLAGVWCWLQDRRGMMPL